MKPTYHHYSALIIAIVVFVVSAGAYAFIYYSIGQQSASTAKAENAVATEKDTAIKQKSIADSLTETAADRAMINSFLLTTDATVPFIEKVEGISKQSGAEVSLVSISADATLVHAHVNIQGSWSSVMRAMHIIENLPYSISMDNVRLTLQGKGDWAEDFDIAIPLATQ